MTSPGRPTARRVLLVEDDDAWVELTREAIHEADPTAIVEAAPGGRDALTRLDVEPLPDLVLLDLNMPGVDGREVLRAVGSRVRPRIVVLSASIAPRDRELVEQLGAAEFATKPITFTGLCELARRLLTDVS